MEEKVTMNKMGMAPVNKLLLSMGIPIVISMVVQAFYNIVDSYFVSKMTDDVITGIGEYGINALSIAFPIQMLMIAFGVGTGVGINALLSKSLGEGNKERASKIAGNAIFLGVCTYILFLLFGIFGIDVYLRSQASDPIVIQLATDYVSIVTIISFGAIVGMIYEKLLQATGKTKFSTVAQILGAVTNIILDPIMIFGWFGCPAMGVKGAAYATVIGQILTLVVSAVFHHGFNKDVDSGFKYFIPEKKVIVEIYKIGIPSIIQQALMSIMVYGANIILAGISDAAVTAYGTYYKIQQFVFFAAFGMNNAIVPLVSFNYGMADKKRVKDSIKYGTLYSVIIMGIGALLLQLMANQLIGLFDLSESTKSLCIMAMRIVTLGYVFAGANIAYQGILQAFGKGVQSLVVSLVRLIIVALPLLYLFTAFNYAENVVWAAFPIAEVVGTVAAIFIMRSVNQKYISKLGVKEESLTKEEDSSLLIEKELLETTESNVRIITISREFGSGGRTIAKLVADKLGYAYYDKEIIEKVAEETGLAEEFIGEQGEHSPSASKSAYSFVGRNMAGLATEDYIWTTQSKIISDLSEKGRCVIVGRCADYVLKDRDDCLNVFIHADIEKRADRIVKLYGETERKPHERLTEKDKKRRINYEHYTGRSWGDCPKTRHLTNS
ncbi:MAG: MATE family efflux transporter [Lachnospiraceae bacterium]